MQKLRILVVGGHPADVFDNAGGTLLRHTRRGDEVTALVLTHGARVHDEVIAEIREKEQMLPPDKFRELCKERSEVKQQEVREACALFGIRDVRFLVYEDLVLMVKENLINEVARVVRELRPHIVLTHFPFDNAGLVDHHAVTGQIVLNGLVAAGQVDPEDSNPPAGVAQVFFFGVPSIFHKYSVLSGMVNAYCSVFVDVSEFMPLKEQSLNKLKSQRYDGDYARKRCETNEGNIGGNVGLPYAEAFIPYLPDIYECLPVSEFRLQRLNEPGSVHMKRGSYIFRPL